MLAVESEEAGAAPCLLSSSETRFSSCGPRWSSSFPCSVGSGGGVLCPHAAPAARINTTTINNGRCILSSHYLNSALNSHSETSFVKTKTDTFNLLRQTTVLVSKSL